MNNWNPRFTSAGAVVSGMGTVVLDGRVIGPGLQPQELAPGFLLVKGLDDRPHQIDLSNGEVTELDPNGPGRRALAAGGGRWLGTEGNRIAVAVGRNGQRAWVEEHNGDNNDHSLFLEGLEIARGSIHNPRLEDGLLVWTRNGGADQETFGRTPNGTFITLHASDVWESSPVPVAAQGAWVVVATNTDIRAYPWGEHHGYIIPTGENMNFHPDAIWLAGELVIVWNDKHGTLHRQALHLSAPRVDLRAAAPVPAPNPHPPTSNPEPVPVSIPNLDRYLTPRVDVIEGVKEDYPHLKGGAIVDQVAHRLNTEHHTDVFGRKARRADGTDLNDDVLTIRLDPQNVGRKKMIDVLGNAHPGDPNKPEDVPRWAVIPAHEEPGNGFWAPPYAPDLDDIAHGDPGDEDTPKPAPVTDPRLETPVLLLRGASARIAEIAAALAVLPTPAVPECPPCPLEHVTEDDGPAFPVASEPELQARVAEWADAFRAGTRRIMPPDLTAFLLYRFVWEGYTHEELLEDAARRGAA